jgi:hypothetical protein
VDANATTQLARFLEREFPGMRLHPGGYGDWPSLRFELGDEIPVEAAEERSAQATERASAIFESAFAPGDFGFFSFARWRKEDDAVLMPLLPASAGGAVEQQEGTDFYRNRNDVPFTSYTVALKPRLLDYQTLFRFTANLELGRSPSLDGCAHVINRSQPLVFHMYDDRGALVFAPEPTSLAPLRAAFGEWLVKTS